MTTEMEAVVDELEECKELSLNMIEELKNAKESGKWNFCNETIAKLNTTTYKALQNHTLDRLFHLADFEHDYYNPKVEYE